MELAHLFINRLQSLKCRHLQHCCGFGPLLAEPFPLNCSLSSSSVLEFAWRLQSQRPKTNPSTTRVETPSREARAAAKRASTYSKISEHWTLAPHENEKENAARHRNLAGAFIEQHLSVKQASVTRKDAHDNFVCSSKAHIWLSASCRSFLQKSRRYILDGIDAYQDLTVEGRKYREEYLDY